MTAPRQVLPGATYLVTRRCSQRQFLLKPSEAANQIFLYVLALAARRHGILLHAFCVLSNHYHLVVTDPSARLPAFLQLLDALVARALNASLGRWESFWAPCSFSAVALLSPADIVDKTAYTLANPVAAGLVRSARSWPGLWSSPGSFGSVRNVSRPEHFFDPRGYLPQSLELELSAPPGFSSVEAFRDQVATALADREAMAAQASTGFLGSARVLSQRPSAKPRPGELRRGLSPRVASRDKWKRIEALRRLTGFLSSYREALDLWCSGRRQVLFPPGTYLMRVLHGAACAGAG
jgi:REP element-mobilizing transposase RayT